jgi:MoaA/NifB/PqqE/SkfB family radical SAM enzyme
MLSLKMLPGALLRYRRTLTARRAINAAKVVASYGLSRLAGRDIRMGRPIVLMVEPTNVCNLKCPLCPSGNGGLTRPRGTMAFQAFRRVFEQQARDLLLLMLWNQGEPFINRDLLRMVRAAKARNVPTITSTNGHFVRTATEAEAVVRSGLDELIVSLDGATPETYVQYRVGGSFERVLAAARLVCEAKRRLGSNTPVVHLQFIIMKHNENEIDAARRIARKLGADRLSLKTAQVYTQADARRYLPTDERYSRYRYGGDGLTMNGKVRNTCRHLWYSTVINWDGIVSPCCFDKDAHYGLGDALDGVPFEDVWEGKRYRDFRNTILKDRASVPICGNCSEGLKGLFYDIEEISR